MIYLQINYLCQDHCHDDLLHIDEIIIYKMVLHLTQKSLFLLRCCFMKCARCKTSLPRIPANQKVPEKVHSFKDERISLIIDVRTPAEYEADHIPGAINLPVLENNDRVTVGTMYSDNQFEARKTGAAIICRNIAKHVDEFFKAQQRDFSPLIYCFRGGQRSYSMALILAQIGFPSFVLEGGYKNYRKILRDDLCTLPEQFEFRVISGLAGSGKTMILKCLGFHGHQILDLEALAKHKGSVLGLRPGEKQPSQKYFESLICDALHSFSPEKPVWLESESVRIGRLYIPQTFFEKTQTAKRYCIHLPLDERVRHTANEYQIWFSEHRNELKVMIRKLAKVRGYRVIDDWLALIESDQWEEFVKRILLEHYDPAYTFSQMKNNKSTKDAEQLNILNLEESTLNALVEVLTK